MNIIRYSIFLFLWIILSKESHIIIKQWKLIDLLRISSPVKLSKVNDPNSKYKSQTFANLYPDNNPRNLARNRFVSKEKNFGKQLW